MRWGAAAASGVGSGPLIHPVRTFREVTESTEHRAHRRACADPRARRCTLAAPSRLGKQSHHGS